MTGLDLAGQVHLERLEFSDVLAERYAGKLIGSDQPVRVTVFNQGFVPDQSRKEAFEEALQALGDTLPPEISSVHSVNFDSDTPFVTEDAPRGPSLKTLLDERKALDWKVAVRLTCSLGRALHYLAERGVIHAGIHPQAVFISKLQEGRIQLGEWAHDILCHPERPLDLAEKNPDGFLGYAGYLAPEVIRDASDADEKSLVYAMGMLLYEMIAGKPPFTSKNPADALKRHLHEKPLKLSIARGGAGLPADIDDILDMMLIKAAERRFQNPVAAISALSSLLDEAPNELAPELSAADAPVFESAPVASSEDEAPEEKADEAADDKQDTKEEAASEADNKKTMMGLPSVAIADESEQEDEQEEAESKEEEASSEDESESPSIIIDDPELRDGDDASDEAEVESVDSAEKKTLMMGSLADLEEAEKKAKEAEGSDEDDASDDKDASEEEKADKGEEASDEKEESGGTKPMGTVDDGWGEIADDVKGKEDAEETDTAEDDAESSDVSDDDAEAETDDAEAETDDAEAETDDAEADGASDEEESEEEASEADKEDEKEEEDTPSIIIDESVAEEAEDAEASDESSEAGDKSDEKDDKDEEADDEAEASEDDAEEAKPKTNIGELGFVETANDGGQEFGDDWFSGGTDDVWDDAAISEHHERSENLRKYLTIGIIGFLVVGSIGLYFFFENYEGEPQEGENVAETTEETAEGVDVDALRAGFDKAFDRGQLIRPISDSAVSFLEKLQKNAKGEPAYEEARKKFVEAAEKKAREVEGSDLRHARDLSGYAAQYDPDNKELQTYSDALHKRYIAGEGDAGAKQDEAATADADADAGATGDQDAAQQAREEQTTEASASTAKPEPKQQAGQRDDQKKQEPSRGSTAKRSNDSAKKKEEPTRSFSQILREAKAAAANNQDDKAIKLFREAISRSPSNPVVHAELGDLLFHKSAYSQALKHHKKASNSSPGNAGYAISLGRTYYRLGRYQEAHDAWERALKNDPNNKVAKKYLGLVKKKL
ncbi:tetratricopeptide repeat protein [Persicimonas caeni]|uniref:Tetratricopeptide repeat protein n=1 Tax=Persicimonas caeni TaxID=2292766 RepID=A0A4Y6PMX1_PERCE|nr:protein kinase [Persicimonas caeni]QDG49642.1 tetratricopeptide repeat protein [Persicimonas caeni]QED30863.1 protein kinase [Persicimonas caeni]